MTIKSFHRLLLIGVITFCIGLSSCNTGTTDSRNIVNEDSTLASTKTDERQAMSGITQGPLDTLYLDKTSFDNLPNGKKIVFAFTFQPSNKLTLNGWIANNTPGKAFDSLPNVQLNSGRPALSDMYNVETYFSSLILQGPDVQKIKTAMVTENANYVLFAPIKLGNNVKYTILVAKEDPALVNKTMEATEAGADLNPSPPKSY